MKMMYLYNIYVCLIATLLHISGSNGNKRNSLRAVRVTYTPKRFRNFETSVKLTFRFGNNAEQENSTSCRIIKIQVFNRKKFVTAINKTFCSVVNQTQLEIPCEVFATPGRYFIEYFIQGLTTSFIQLTPKPIIVRNERVHIEVPKNHTAFDGSVSAWLNSKKGRCKPLKGKLKLYWVKNKKEHVLVTTRKVDENKIEDRTRVFFRCNVFDTEGTFYFAYFSDYNNRKIARSHNMSVSWGKYEIVAQSKNIFPCSNSFVIKFSSPYCDRTEDKIEMRSKAYNNVINSQIAYHGFRSVFFPCVVFKKHIRDYCFHYITKSSLSVKRKIQATLCVSTVKTEPRWSAWTEWSAWGTCSSRTECGKGRKYRLRFCPPANPFQTSKEKPQCIGEQVQSTPCTLPPCKGKKCKSCGCVLSTPAGGTIVSPKTFLPFVTKERSICHWYIEIAKGMKIKLWFDSLKLARNSSVVIRDGNTSNSAILKKITYENQRPIADIYSTSNVVTVWYSNSGKFNRNSTGFTLSYASVDKLKTAIVLTSSQTGTKRIAKMTFIGILAVLIAIMFTVIAIIMVRIRRQRSNENATKTFSQRPSSAQTSTACMSESTMRSCYEPQLSGDESTNNNSTLSRINNNNRPRVSTRIEHRTPVHVCPKCCPHVEHYPCEYRNSYHGDGRRTLTNDSYYAPSVDDTQATDQAQRVRSTIERRLSATSFLSDETFPRRNYPKYL